MVQLAGRSLILGLICAMRMKLLVKFADEFHYDVFRIIVDGEPRELHFAGQSLRRSQAFASEA